MSPATSVFSTLLRKLRNTTCFAVLALLALALMPARAAAQCSLNPTDPSVTICTPTAGQTVTSPVHVVAGTTSSKTISSIWVYLDNNSTPAVKFSGVTSIDTNIPVPTGSHTIKVKAWTTTGTLFQAWVTVNVTTSSGPVVSLSPTSLNFGAVNVGSTSAPQTVMLKNTGTSNLNITSIAASGDYSQTNGCGTSLAPGGSCTISVTFTPTATGTRTGTLTLNDDAANSPQTVSLTGTGGSISSCSPSNVDPSMTVCSPTNGSTLTSPVHVQAAAYSSQGISAIWVYLDNNSTPAAKFPDASSIDTDIPVPTGTHLIRVKGWTKTTATLVEKDVTVTVTSSSGPVATVTPTSLNFGTVNVGSTSAPQTVTLKNTGTATLNITSIGVTGDYAQTNVCGTSLSAGGSCTISVTFTPTATGTRNGTLSISDDASGSPHTVSLTGTGGSGAGCTASNVNPSVTICTPTPGSTVSSPVHVVALTTSTTYPTTAIWIYVDYAVVYKSPSGAKSIDTSVPMATGTRRVRVQAWNSAGQVYYQEMFINVSGSSGPVAQLSPTSLNFGNVTVGETAGPQTVTLSNTGTEALSITSIAATGDYSQTNSCGSSVAAGANCTISVSFKPTTTGTRNGTLSVTDNAPNSPQTVALTGVGQTVGGGGNIPINHFIFMLQENRSFDQYFSNLNNYRAARGYSTEVDVASPTATQPQDNGNYISRFHMRTMCIEELSPNWLESHGDANRWNPSSDNILMDGFVHTAQGMANWAGFWDKGGYRAMGYYTETDLPYYYFMATQFATSDSWFSPVPTNSTVNRVYGFAATSAGHVHDSSWTISNKTIFQLLAENGHTWKIYYTDVDSSGTPASRIWRFQPFASNNKSHIVPMSQFYTDIANGTLPDYAFIESGFLSGRDEHPGGTISGNPNSGNHVQRGAAYAASIINALMKSPSWHDSAFILSWDEVGGPYDHVKPMMNIPSPDGIPPLDLYSGDPSGDFTRSGFRVPMMVVSPWSKPHYVSHTPMDYTAVLKLVETRFGLSPLTARDAAQPDMTEFFDFVNKPWATPPSPPSQPTSGECNYTDMP